MNIIFHNILRETLCSINKTLKIGDLPNVESLERSHVQEPFSGFSVALALIIKARCALTIFIIIFKASTTLVYTVHFVHDI